MRKNLLKSVLEKFGLTILFFAPVFVFALTSDGTPENLTDFVNNFISLLNQVLPFVIGFGFFGVLTGVLKYVGAGADEERLGKAKQLIFYGSIGIIVLYSFWGLANLLAKSYLGV